MNRRLWRDWRAYACLACILLITAFIFSNSMRNGDTSHAQSDRVVRVVQPIIQPVLDPEANWSWEDYRYIVRKAAHFAEFMLLGVACALFYLLIARGHISANALIACFYTLLVAVTDEYIQSFFERSSMITDVYLDFFGALTGIVLSIGVAHCVRRRVGRA